MITSSKADYIASANRLRALQGTPEGKVERIEDGIKITDYDPARAPTSKQLLKEKP
jgi:hypothetical protein